VRRRRWPYVLGVLAVVAVAVVFRGDLTLLFSADRPVVTTLERDVVYVEPGAPRVDVAGIRQTFGRRPLAMVVLRPGSALAAHPDGVCKAVVDRIDNLIVAVNVGGEFRYGCESSDVPIVRNAFGWDFVQWEQHDSAVQYLPDDLRAQADQLAARYDADVTGGSLRYRPRTFHQPVTRYLLSGALLLLVVAGVVALDVGLNRSVRAATHHRAERARWRARRADLDASLSEVAMIMLDLSPPPPPTPTAARADPTGAAAAERDGDPASTPEDGDPASTPEAGPGVAGPSRAERRGRRRADRLAALSADYLTALADAERAAPGDDLSELEHRVAGLRERARTLERQ
jgi:hypothetical protein